MLAEILGNYVTLLASDKRGGAELKRLAHENYRGMGKQLHGTIK